MAKASYRGSPVASSSLAFTYSGLQSLKGIRTRGPCRASRSDLNLACPVNLHIMLMTPAAAIWCWNGLQSEQSHTHSAHHIEAWQYADRSGSKIRYPSAYMQCSQNLGQDSVLHRVCTWCTGQEGSNTLTTYLSGWLMRRSVEGTAFTRRGASPGSFRCRTACTVYGKKYTLVLCLSCSDAKA